MTELKTTISLHKAWWAAVLKLQGIACPCKDVFDQLVVCELCSTAVTELQAAEQALRDANEWELPT